MAAEHAHKMKRKSHNMNYNWTKKNANAILVNHYTDVVDTRV